MDDQALNFGLMQMITSVTGAAGTRVRDQVLGIAKILLISFLFKWMRAPTTMPTSVRHGGRHAARLFAVVAKSIDHLASHGANKIAPIAPATTGPAIERSGPTEADAPHDRNAAERVAWASPSRTERAAAPLALIARVVGTFLLRSTSLVARSAAHAAETLVEGEYVRTITFERVVDAYGYASNERDKNGILQKAVLLYLDLVLNKRDYTTGALRLGRQGAHRRPSV